MLIQRIRNGEHWQWHITMDESRPGHARIAAGEWDVLVVGSHGPALPRWLETSFSQTSAPLETLRRSREEDEGHYALACVNRTWDEVYLCSDPYAIAKIYWWSAAGRFVIGTDLPVVLRTASASPLDLDEHACGYFFMCGYLPGRHTFHRDVFKVPPAAVWRITAGEKVERSYVDLMVPPDLSSNAYVADVSSVWRTSIMRYLEQFPEPIVALSGGVDSTLLLASFKKVGGGASGLVARTGVTLGGEASIVLNPYDRQFGQRVAKDLGVRHEEVHYDLNGPRLFGHLAQAIGSLGTESHVGTLMFRSLGGETVSPGSALFAAQNADSVFSFAVTGWPKLEWGLPPHVVGLGGWCTRYNLFGGFDRPGGLDQWAAQFIFDQFLRRRFGVSWSALRPADRVVGLAFDGEKRPVHPNRRDFPHVRNSEAVVGWFLKQYWETQLAARFHENPHGAFMHIFLHNYMQGTANRGTVWYPTITGMPTFLPFASLSILRLTGRLRSEPKNYWFGKLPVLRMAESEYAVPDYVRKRSDPSMPELDRLYYESIVANKGVATHLEALLHGSPETGDRLKAVLVPQWLNAVASRIKERALKGSDARWAISLLWLLEIERQAWGPR